MAESGAATSLLERQRLQRKIELVRVENLEMDCEVEDLGFLC